MTMLKQYLYRYQGHIGAYLVVVGVDATGPQLFTVHAHGSTDKLPYVTMGSGSLAAMAIFESAYKENMTRKEAIELVARAIRSGVFNDLGSGSNVDVCVITKSGTETLRNYEKPVSTNDERSKVSGGAAGREPRVFRPQNASRSGCGVKCASRIFITLKPLTSSLSTFALDQLIWHSNPADPRTSACTRTGTTSSAAARRRG